MRAIVCIFTVILACGTESSARDSFEGTPCDDHDPCTIDDRFSGGMCRGTPRDCSDSLSCTEALCDRKTGRCVVGLRLDACLIDGACWKEGESNPANPCLVCRPSHSSSAWSETTTCDDGDPCTLDDRCHDGLCAGTAYTCSGGGTCSISRCDGKGGCVEEALSGYCRIDGFCVRDGHAHPFDPCLRCDPSAATNRWTAATGASCPGGTCLDGKCLATLVLELTGTGKGRVVGPGFVCASSCVQNVAPERRIDLTVVPESGSSFLGWQGACTGIAPCSLVPGHETHATAIFAATGEGAPD